MFSSGISLAFHTALLGFRAQNVAALRIMRLAASGAAGQAEAMRMVSEKIAAFAEAQLKASAAAAKRPDAAVGKDVRADTKRVRANRHKPAR